MPRGTRNIGSVLLHGVPAWQPREILFESLFSKTLVCDEEQACSRLLEVVHSFLLLISVDEAMDRYVDPTFQQVVFSFAQLVANYFTSSDPHHDMLGGGCQVRVVIENMMGRMENLKTLISGFLGLVILVRWALVTMFLS